MLIRCIFLRLCHLLVVVIAITSLAFTQTTGIFYDSNNEQIKFAAGDVRNGPQSIQHSLALELPTNVIARIDLYYMTGSLVKTILEQQVEAVDYYEAKFLALNNDKFILYVPHHTGRYG